MRRPMHLGAFLFNLGNHIAAWRHPDVPADQVMSLGFYRNLAQVAERGCFDFLFHSDGVGINDAHPAIVAHTVTPRPEPIALLSALAACTERIGLAATVSTTYAAPYHVARAFATLDHLSGGRAAINVVTSSTDQEAQNFGQPAQMPHDERYRRLLEFVGVVRALWDSWADGAVLADKPSGRYADPARVRPIDHRGAFLAVRGPLNVPRPPQGHPPIIQAGVSPAGLAAAGAVADLVFTVNLSMQDALARRRAMHAAVAQAGRDPAQVRVLPGLMPVLGGTEQQAQATHAALQALTPPEIAIPYLSDLVQHDLTGYPADGPLPPLPPMAGEQGRLKLIQHMGREGLSLGAIAHRMLLARGHFTLVGTPEQVADTMERWFRAGACDGFNILAPWHPGGLEAFVDQVVPLLQARGLARRAYEGTTLREHLGLRRV